MGDIRGFIKHDRQLPERRSVPVRLRDWHEVYEDFPEADLRRQASRCMDCGIPFCNHGCPLGNLIPDWNDLSFRGQWREAIDRLHSTNNFPEFTGRLCPAPCEAACVLGINEPAVTIKQVEVSIVDRAWEKGWIRPIPASRRSGRRVAVVGSGPAGLAAAQQLTRAGHEVVVFERADRIGGLLRFGIPEFKLEKRHLDRRLAQMEAEGTEFRTRTNVGGDLPLKELRQDYDAVVLACGATRWRDLPIPGRDLEGVMQAMEYLPWANRVQEGDLDRSPVSAEGRHVVVIGGGDTGADCIGTSLRHGCKNVVNFELLDKPPSERAANNPWPQWPRIYRLDYSHEENMAKNGKDPRAYNILAKEFVGDQDGHIKGVKTVEVDWSKPVEGGAPFSEVEGSEKEWPADLVLLATGFVGPELEVGEMLGLETQNPRGNWQTFVGEHGEFTTNIEGVFVAGDCRRGQSLVVWAINEGRGAARSIDSYLMGSSLLPAPGITQGSALAGA